MTDMREFFAREREKLKNFKHDLTPPICPMCLSRERMEFQKLKEELVRTLRLTSVLKDKLFRSYLARGYTDKAALEAVEAEESK